MGQAKQMATNKLDIERACDLDTPYKLDPIPPLMFKPGFHIVVSVMRKKFIGQIEFILSRTTSCICRFFCIEHLYGRFP